MMDGSLERRIALAVESFLPASQIWIWRQMQQPELYPRIILTQQVLNAQIFDHPHVIVGPGRSLGYRKIEKKLWAFFKNRKPALTAAGRRAFKDALIAYKIDTVHAHFGTVAAALMDVCRELNIPLVVTFHGFDATAVPYRWPGYKEKLHDVFRYASGVLAISQFVKEQLQQLGCPQDKLFVSYLGVPANDFHFEDRRNRSGKIRFLHLGRIVEKKGVPDLARAFVMAFPQVADVELTIIGSGEEENEVRSLIKDLKPVNTINIKSSILPEQVKEELSNADVFVLNSRKDSQQTTEGLPIGLLEAMAAGLPVVSTVHAGIPEVVENGVNGYLVPEKDISALAEALKKCTVRFRNHELGKAASATIYDRFSLSECNRNLVNLYQRIFR